MRILFEEVMAAIGCAGLIASFVMILVGFG